MNAKRLRARFGKACFLAALGFSVTTSGDFSSRVELRSGRTAVSQAAAANLRRLSFEDLVYEGAFRVPRGSANGDSFDFGGKPLAFNPSAQSLFVASYRSRLAEISIPKVVRSSNVEELPFAEFRQEFRDPSDGRMSEVGSDGVGLHGAVVYGNRIYGSVSIYYDANNSQRLSHFSRSLQLQVPSFLGWSRVWEADRTGFVAGFMALIPQEWQALLGGNALTGQCCIPIVSRTSWGPAAFAFDLSKVGERTVAAAPLLYYTGEHPTLGQWDETNPSYGIATGMGGVAVIAGTRTALYFGRNGEGKACYGTGTARKELDGTNVGDGSKYCYDPTNSSKGTHAYPYRYQIWAYDLTDFAAVKAGRKRPWDVRPYGVWPFDLPIVEPGVNLGGVGYDPQGNRIYVAQLGADQDGNAYRPLIHAFRVQ